MVHSSKKFCLLLIIIIFFKYILITIVYLLRFFLDIMTNELKARMKRVKDLTVKNVV